MLITVPKLYEFFVIIIIQFWSGFIPINRGGWIYTTLIAISPTPTHDVSILLDSWHPPSPNQHSYSPSLLVSSTSSLVVLASSCPSLQTPMLFSKHAHHPSSTHTHTAPSHINTLFNVSCKASCCPFFLARG